MNKKQYAFDKSILRAYDIRGQWQKTLHAQDAYALGRTLGGQWKYDAKSQKDDSGDDSGENSRDNSGDNSSETQVITQVLVARDGRASSSTLSCALLQGFADSGVEGRDLGILPTPALYFAEVQARKNSSAEGSRAKKVAGAVMVTGSHNPPDHNGFKIVHEGRPFFGQDLQDIATSMAQAPTMQPRTPSDECPDERQTSSADSNAFWREAYCRRLLEEDAGTKAGELVAVWDMGGGAGAAVAKELVEGLQGEHRLLFAEIDSTFKDRSPDPAEPHALDRLRDELVSNKAQIGLAFDGDADRLVVLSSQGVRLSGEQLMFLFAADLLHNSDARGDARGDASENNNTTPPLVLCDIKTSPRILRAIQGLGGRAALVPTGHAHVKHALATRGAAMAGEMSGHMFFNDRYEGYDDALYAAVRLCSMLRAGFVLEQILALLPASISSDEMRLPVEEARKFALIDEIQQYLAADTKKKAYSLCTLDGVRVEHADGRWWLLRASNTEAALVLRAEAPDASRCRALLLEIQALLQRHNYKPPQSLSDTPLVEG